MPVSHNSHIKFDDDKLEKFYREFRDHVIDERHLVERIDELADTIAPVAEVMQNVQGALTVLATIGRIIKWLAGLALAVAALWGIVTGWFHPTVPPTGGQ